MSASCGLPAPEPESFPRRRFIVGVAMTGAGLLLGAETSLAAESSQTRLSGGDPSAAAGGRFSAYLEITPDDEVRIVSPQTELGQGIFDTLAMIIADELDADWSRVVVKLPHANKAFASPLTKRQRIGGSDSVMSYREPLRQVGAAAREMLVSAAAVRWQVAVEGCTTANGEVVHAASGRRLAYGSLATDAARLPVPTQPQLKSAPALRLTGKRLVRKDTPAKVDGSARFAIDVREPGMLFAALRRAPSLGGKLIRFDDAGIRSRPGVVAVVPLEDAVAVLAGNWWVARQAAEALDVQFDVSAMQQTDSQGLLETMRRALDDDVSALEQTLPVPGAVPPRRQPADRAAINAAFERADSIKIDVTYEVPYLAHMTMEPQSCVAKVSDGHCHVWGGLQQPDQALELAAQLTGLSTERVRVDVTFAGGGFGRRWELDTVRQVVNIARQVPGRAVNLLWTREQDMQHDFYRPAHMARYRASLDPQGRVLALHGRSVGQSLLGYKGIRRNRAAPDGSSTFGLIPVEYALSNVLCDWVELKSDIPIGFWRAVGASQNGFFAESMIDELAHAARRDPVQFRRELLRNDPRASAVFERLVQESGWTRPLRRGHGRGIALNTGFGSVCGQVVEVSMSGSAVKIEQITCVYDCGLVLNPSTVEAQLEGGIIYGLSAALDGEITIRGGKVEQGNFHDQPMLRLTDVPAIKIVLLSSDRPSGGVGEGGVPPVAAALANAIFAATGRRHRKLPLRAAMTQT